MQSTVRSVAVGIQVSRPDPKGARNLRQVLVVGILAMPLAFLPPVPQATSRQPGEPPALLAQPGPRAARNHDGTVRFAQKQMQVSPSLDVVQVLLVEPGKEVPLSLQVKAAGPLPRQSFIRIKGLPRATSLSEGHFVREGVWAVPLSALPSVTISVPAGQTGRSELTISLVSVDNTVLAETSTTLVVGTASLFPVKPLAPPAATPAKEPKGPKPKLDGPEVTLRPSGRRTFAAVVPRLAPGHHAATLRTGGRTEPLDVVVPERTPSGRERRAAGPNRALLAEVAALTGGTLDPAPTNVLRARPGTRRRRTSLDGLLVPLAIVLVLADVALRRLGTPR